MSDMMDKFKEWHEGAFKAGAESRQAEIDELKKKIEWYKDKHAKALRRQFNLENESEPMSNRVDELKEENKKLREGINKAMDYRTPMGSSMTDWFNTIVNILREALKNGG